MKNYYFASVVAFLITLFPLAAFASDVQVAKTINVSSTQPVAQNEYLAGGQIIFSTTAQKDLVAAGAEITVNGPVWGDALLAGGVVQVLQEVRGDVRVAGGHVTIANSVSGDVLVAGGTVTVLPNAVIGGDVILMGGALDMQGTINGSLRAYGGDVTVNGTVAGPVSIKAGKSVAFGDKTILGNALVYSSPKEATVAAGAKLGSRVTYNPLPQNIPHAGNIQSVLWTILGVLTVVKFLGLLLIALILTLAFKGFSHTLAETFLGNFWKSAGVGFVALVVTPIAAILLALTVVGIYLTFFLVLAYLLYLLLAGVYMGIFTGTLLSKWIVKEPVTDWKWAILGTLVVFLLSFVPIVGWIIDAFLMFASFGVLVTYCWKELEAKRGM